MRQHLLDSILYLLIRFTVALYMVVTPFDFAGADGMEVESYHVGFLHPDGVDIAGYSNEKHISGNLYRFYTFGFPSLAAIGVNYYGAYSDDGINANVGVGIGSVLYGSLNYRWTVEHGSHIRAGAGYTTGVAYSGWYPVVSYEARFKH